MVKSIIINLLLAIFLLGNLTGCSRTEIFNPGGEPIKGGSYYVAPGGSDVNPGSFDKPWGTWQKAFETAVAGDTVYFRGGVYYVKQIITAMGTLNPPAGHGHNGTSDNYICFFNYPGETPILDGSFRSPPVWNTGLDIVKANYIHFRGLTVRNLKQPSKAQVAGGIGTNDCSNLIFENMTVHDIGGIGYRYLGALGYWPPIVTDTTYFINCDAYNCCDNLSSSTAGQHGGGTADGFKADNEVGSYIVFEGCRAWNCSDDGFDLSGSTLGVFNNCWSVSNGYLDGDGTGFKNAFPRDHVYTPIRVMTNCIAAFNRAVGFSQIVDNDYCCMSFSVMNCIGYKNDRGFADRYGENCLIPKDKFYRNNISYGSKEIKGYEIYSFKLDVIHSNNSWDSAVTISDADFVSLSPEGLIGNRKADGSLPDLKFFKLAKGSDLIGAGVNVGMSANPDMGIDWAYLNRK
jgi:hypothetical protein